MDLDPMDINEEFLKSWNDFSQAYKRIAEAGDVEAYAALPSFYKNFEKWDEKRRQRILDFGLKTNWERLHSGDISSEQGHISLHFAAKDGHTSVVKSLLKKNVKAVNYQSRAGLTPLHLSSIGGHLETTKILLDHKAGVSTRDSYKLTPLHYASENGHVKIVKLLLQFGAQKDPRDTRGFTPLHYAAQRGYVEIIQLLIDNKADVNASCMNGMSPLFPAAIFGHVNAAECLVRNKCDVNLKIKPGFLPKTALEMAVDFGRKEMAEFLIKQRTGLDEPLYRAIATGQTEIAEMLLQNGADVNFKGESQELIFAAILWNRRDLIGPIIRHGADLETCRGAHVGMAICCGYHEIVDALLENGVPLECDYFKDGTTMLHLAAKLGKVEVAKILLKHGANVNSLCRNSISPLCLAVSNDHKKMTEFLLASGANVNQIQDCDGTCLHLAANMNLPETFKVLLENGADLAIEDKDGITALEHAVELGHLAVVALIADSNMAELNQLTGRKVSLLNRATQIACDEKDRDFKMVKLLVSKGASIHLSSPEYPLQKAGLIAVRFGFVELVEFFLSHGLDIQNEEVLTHAIFEGNINTAKYLIKRGANIKGPMAMQAAACNVHRELVELLLAMGATYKTEQFRDMPLHKAESQAIIDMLLSTEALFSAVNDNKVSKIIDSIKKDAYLNAKNPTGETALCIATRKGLSKATQLLLKNGADPNISDSTGMTPLHYAAKKGLVEISGLLLAYGAVFEVEAGGKTPADLSTNQEISALLTQIAMAFEKIDKNNGQVIKDLKAIKNPDWINAVFGARNSKNKTLMSVGTEGKFSKVNQLKEFIISDDDREVAEILVAAGNLTVKSQYGQALMMLELALKDRKKKTGKVNDKGTLELKHQMAKTIYKQGEFSKAMKILEQVYNQQKDLLGLNSRDTLNSRSMMALVLHRQCKFEEAIAVFREVVEQQKKLFGEGDSDTLGTLFHMALTLHELKQHEEGLAINELVYKRRLEDISSTSTDIVGFKNNYAHSLQHAGRIDEALNIFMEVLEEKKKLFGLNHGDTCRTINSIGGILMAQGNHREALREYQQVIAIHKEIFPENYPETLMTQYNVCLTYMQLGELIKAYHLLAKIFTPIKATFPPAHHIVADVTQRMNILQPLFGHLKDEPDEIYVAAMKGDVDEVIRQAKKGHVNDTDSEGRTALHFAAEVGNIVMVKALLGNGADATIGSRKGNTPLHIATVKGNIEIVQLLLKYTNQKKMTSFINTRTVANEMTALHVAAKQGSLLIIKLLLKNSASFNIKNYQGKTPLDLAKDPKVRQFLLMTHQLFEALSAGNPESLKILSKRPPDEFQALIRAKNIGGKTLYQVAVENGRHEIAKQLLQIIKTPPEDVLCKLFEFITKKQNSEIAELVKTSPEVVHKKDSEGRAALHQAVSKNNLEAVKILLENGAVLDRVTSKGNTALHLAVLNSNVEIATILLKSVEKDKLANFVNAKTVTGYTTALHVAAKIGNFDMVTLLLRNSAIYNALNKDKKTPVDSASDDRVAEFLKFVDVIFGGASIGEMEIIQKLQKGIRTVDEMMAMRGAFKEGGGSILDIVFSCGFDELGKKLLDMWPPGIF